jgi:hypothetical protein
VSSNVATGVLNAPPVEVARRLRILCEHPQHNFWFQGPSLLDADLYTGIDRSRMHTCSRWRSCIRGQFVTFDAAIPLRAVKGATESSLVTLLTVLHRRR